MNEQIIKNIALCYADTEKNQVEVMLSFAKLLMNKDVSRLYYLNDYLESGLEIEKKEPFIKNILRDVLENHIDEPGLFLKMVAESDIVEDKNGVIDYVRNRMMERGYFEDKVVYVCPHCGHELPIQDVPSGECPKCNGEVIKQINAIKHTRQFKDFFQSEEVVFHPTDKRYAGKNKKIVPEAVIEDYTLPEPYSRKDEDTGVNPFFSKRMK